MSDIDLAMQYKTLYEASQDALTEMSDELVAARDENEHLQALLHRWIVWNGEGRHHDLEDETRRALAWRGDEGQF